MRVIGDRISVLKKEDLLSIVILAASDRRKVMLLMIWLLLWSSSGVIVFANYFNITNKETKLFIIVFLSFWAYYEFKMIRVFAWRRSGKEKLWIQRNILHYQREINGKGKIAEFNLDLVNDMRMLDVNEASFSDFFNQSFWVKGGEKLAFDSQGKTIRFGMQISEEEARALFKEIKAFVKNSH